MTVSNFEKIIVPATEPSDNWIYIMFKTGIISRNRN